MNLLEIWAKDYQVACINEPPDLSIIKAKYPITYGKNEKKVAMIIFNTKTKHKLIREDPSIVTVYFHSVRITLTAAYLSPSNNGSYIPICAPIVTTLENYQSRSIIVSDVNAKLKQLQQSSEDTPRARHLIKAINNNGWNLLNRPEEYTHQARRTNQLVPPSVIDWVIATHDLEQYTDHEVLPRGNESDHAPILITINDNCDTSNEEERMIIHIPTFLSNITTIKATLPSYELIQQINLAVEKSLKKICPPKLDKTTNHNLDKELKRTLRRRDRAKGTAKLQLVEKVKILRKQIDQDKKKHQAIAFEKKLKSSNATEWIQKQISNRRNHKEKIENVINDENQIINNPTQIADFIMTHLFPAEQNCQDDASWPATQTNDPNPITHYEIEKAIKKQSNSSPGIDQMNKEVIRAWYHKDKTFFQQIFNEWLNGSTIPEQMITTQLTLIKKDKNLPPTKSNIRPIGKPCVITRIYERIILNRINFYIPELANHNPMQFAHQRELTLHHALYQLTHYNYHSPSTVIFIACDIKGAYNRIHHGPILKYLAMKNVPNNLIHCANNLLKDRPMSIFGQLKLLPIGLPQGAVISPNFFNFGIQNAIEQTYNQLKLPISITAFCDDITIRLPTYYNQPRVDEKINLILTTLNNELNKVNLNLSLQKTRIITTNHLINRLPPITIENDNVPMVTSHKVLGIELQLPHPTKLALYKKRIFSKALKSVFEIKRFLRNPKLSSHKKQTLVSSYIHSIILTNVFLWYNNHMTLQDMNALMAIDRVISTLTHNLPATIPNIVAFALQDDDPLIIKAGYIKQIQLMRIEKNQNTLIKHVGAQKTINDTHPSHNSTTTITEPLLSSKNLEKTKSADWTYYTDASMSSLHSPIGTALVLIDKNDQIADIATAKLHKTQNVFIGEAYAVWAAIEHSISRQLKGKINIYTDSMSVINALTNITSPPTIIETIQKRIITAKRQQAMISIGWCKAHNQIIPNELADYLAKQATNWNQQTIILPANRKGILSMLKEKIYQTKNNFYTAYKPSTQFKIFFPTLEHVEKYKKNFNSATLRIYIGHGPFIFDAIKYHSTKHLNPACRCDCKTTQSILHLLTQCPTIQEICHKELQHSGLQSKLQKAPPATLEDATHLHELHIFIKLAANKIIETSKMMLNEVDYDLKHKPKW